MINLIQS